MSNPFESSLAWNCDFCNKPGLIIGRDGVIYCKLCHKTYGKHMLDDLSEEQRNKFKSQIKEILSVEDYTEMLKRIGLTE